MGFDITGNLLADFTIIIITFFIIMVIVPVKLMTLFERRIHYLLERMSIIFSKRKKGKEHSLFPFFIKGFCFL